jgi:predicted Ser/Thr protein kinase
LMSDLQNTKLILAESNTKYLSDFDKLSLQKKIGKILTIVLNGYG